MRLTPALSAYLDALRFGAALATRHLADRERPMKATW
jgi:hypothetical protein